MTTDRKMHFLHWQPATITMSSFPVTTEDKSLSFSISYTLNTVILSILNRKGNVAQKIQFSILLSFT